MPIVQVLFTEIVAGDVDAVRARLERDPSLVGLVASAPPKHVAGQSPLQIAYRNGAFEIAAMLLERGADPDFVEHAERDPWAMPVLHHAIMASVMRSRWLRPTAYGARDDQRWGLRNTAARADAAFDALVLLLDSGASVHALDSFGNSAPGRATLDARQILPTHRRSDPDWVDPKPLNDELVEDLVRIFGALRARGADPRSIEPHLGVSLVDHDRDEPVVRFLDDAR